MSPIGGSSSTAHPIPNVPVRGRFAFARPLLRVVSAALAGASLLGGCAFYHALPLAHAPDLAGGLSGLRTQVPGPAPGEASRRIDTDAALTLTDVGLLAVLNDPQLRAQRGEMDLAQAGLLQASLLPNPSASVNYAQLVGGHDITNAAWTASLTQDVKAILTYHTRVKSARFLTRQVNADLLWQQWQVAQKARLLALDLYWGGVAVDLSRREVATVGLEVRQARKAAQAGSLALTALAPLLAAKASADQTLASLSLSQLQNWQALDALLGLEPNVRFTLAAPSLAPLPKDLRPLLASLPDRRPDLVALKLGYRSADEDVRTAIIGQFPAFLLGAAWGQDTGNVRSVGPTATFDLPIFDRNQGQIAIARATRLTLHEQYQARLDAAVGAVKGLAAQIRRLKRDVSVAQHAAAAAAVLSSSAQRAYALGAIDQRALADYETTALNRELEAVTLARALGEADIVMTVELARGLPETRIAAPQT